MTVPIPIQHHDSIVNCNVMIVLYTTISDVLTNDNFRLLLALGSLCFPCYDMLLLGTSLAQS